MNILITNDDGVQSPGLLALAQALSSIANISILAPDRNWSVTGHYKTLSRPIRIQETKLEDDSIAWTGDCSPADCVCMGLHGFFGKKFDLVVSGINTTANVAQDITSSGTVTSAMEAAVHGFPAIAFSLDSSTVNGNSYNYSEAAAWAKIIVGVAKNQTFAPQSILNVNIPSLPKEKIKGFQITRLGQRVYHDRLEKRTDPRGKDYYWMLGQDPTGIPQGGTDVGALAENYISITPIHLDMTAYHWMQNVMDWDQMFQNNQPERDVIHYQESYL